MSSPEHATDPVAEPDVVHWYTHARKIPTLIGKTAAGGKIWGGPYTAVQVIGAVSVLVVMYKTIGWWAPDSLIMTLAVLGAAGFGTLKALALIPLSARNPMIAALGIAMLPLTPRAGTSAGRNTEPGRNRRPLIPGRPAALWVGDLPATVPEIETELEPSPVEVPGPEREPIVELDTSRPALTALQRLLADAARTDRSAGGLSRQPPRPEGRGL